MSDSKLCLRPDCGGKAKTRGLCQKCYAIARDVVKRGQSTWAKLESEGKVAVAKPWRAFSPSPAREWLLTNGAVTFVPPVELTEQQVEEAMKIPVNRKTTPSPISKLPPSTMSPNPPAVPSTKAMICIECHTPLAGQQYARTRTGATLCIPCATKRATSNTPTRIE